MAARCSTTRSANCASTCRSSSCARCRRARSTRSAPSARSRSMSASSRPPTAISAAPRARRPVPRGPVLPPQRLSDLRAEPARPPRRYPRPGAPLHRPLRGGGEQAGRRPDAGSRHAARDVQLAGAMSASSRTRSSAPWSCATARCSTSPISPQIAAALGVDARASRPPASAAMSSAHAPTPSYAASAAPAHCLALCDQRHRPGGATCANWRMSNPRSSAWRSAVTDGHMSEVARRLGIGRSTLYRKLKELGLDPDAPQGRGERGNIASDLAPSRRIALSSFLPRYSAGNRIWI